MFPNTDWPGLTEVLHTCAMGRPMKGETRLLLPPTFGRG